MMAWGEVRLGDMKEQLRPERVEGRLIQAKLFPTEGEDELHDPLGDPPSASWW